MRTVKFKKIPTSELACFARHLATLSLIVLVFSLLLKYIPQKATYEDTGAEKNLTASQSLIPSYEPMLCTLKLCGDTLGIYSSAGILEYTAKIDPNLLTDYDRRLLDEGICATYDELSELICELLS